MGDHGRRGHDQEAAYGAPVRVTVLLNFIAPYRRPFLEHLAARVGRLRILLSTRMEANRPWRPDWGTLDVTVQRTLTVPARFQRPDGISQQLYIHVSPDTLPRLHAHDPDVVVSGEFGARSLQAALYRLLRPRSRLIVWATLSEHTERDWGLIRRVLRRAILKRADAVVVNGGSGERYIRSLDRQVPVTRMAQPVDTALFARCPLDRDPDAARRLIYVGRLIPLKGVMQAQAAVASWAWAHPGTRVEMAWAGDGEERARLEAATLPGNMRQSFPGFVDYEVLSTLYAACGAMILPTLLDEWGLVVNEALASGLPVIGSIYSQAVEELVEPGRNGWLFDPREPGTLRAALDGFFGASPEELAAMRAASRRRGLSITFEEAAGTMAAVIEHVRSLPDRPGPRRWVETRRVRMSEDPGL